MPNTSVRQLDKGMPASLRRAPDPIRVVLIAGLVGILLLSAAYFSVDALADRSASQTSREAVTAAEHPVMSARRAPTTLSFTSRTGSVRRALNNVSTRLPSGGCLRVDWMGETLASTKSDTPFIPASASKLLTAAVALEVLGGSYTFETQIYSEPVTYTGVVANVYVVGGGDPVLVRKDYPATEKYPTINGTAIESLVTGIISSGVKQISQSISVVDNRYDQTRYLDIWPRSFYGVEAGPLGALMMNDSTIIGTPGRSEDPALASGAEISALLSQQGVSVATNVQRVATLPTSAVKISSVTSAPLSSILQEMLVNSDNNTAELLVKELGFVKKGTGTTAAGLEVIAETVKQWNLPFQPVVVDGSGLSSSNSLNCDTFATLLEKNKEIFPSLLAIAGESGTLKTTFTDTAVEGRLVAKTGTLTGVKSLVGYLPLEEEDDVHFALMMNSSGIDNPNSFRPIWNSLAEALNRARSSPRPEELAP